MSVKLILKNSKVQFKNATSSQLANAELAINFHQSGPYLQAKGDDGTVHAVGGVYISASAPSNPLSGRWWYDDNSDKLFLYDGTAWQSIGGGSGGGGSTTVVGADGITATTAGDTVTVSVDLASDSHGLSIASGQLQANLATESSAGTVIVGDGLSISGLGVLSADGGGAGDLNPLAGRALTYDGGTTPETLNADIATAAALGVVKVGDGIDVDVAGEISVSFPPSETYIGETPPADPSEGDLWWNSSDDSGRLYVYYVDADSSQWVEASPQGETLTEGEADGLYLSRVTDDIAKGEITFEGTTTHEQGIYVTGAAGDTTKSRVNGGTDSISIARSSDLGGFVSIGSSGLASLNCASTTTTGVVAGGAITYPNSSSGADIYSFRQQVKVPENSSKNINGITSWFSPKNTTDNYTGDVRLFNASLGGSVAASYNNVYGYWSSGQIANTSQISGLRVGFGAVMDNTSDLTFAFHSDGTANNFFKGNTYIGGTTAPNTFELYKSTLTEEQLEELTAGTLVAPANVSLPGDGEFARQWYYDRQDTETQAELDAGTLDYPTHLAAATFTDTFALGDNTNINLMSSGNAYFGNNIGADNSNPGVNIIASGIVTARRAATSNVWVGYETGNSAGTSFIKASGRMGLGGEPFDNSVLQITGAFAGDAGNGLGIRTDAVLTAGDNAGSVCGIDSRVSTTDTGSELIQFRARGVQSTAVTRQMGFAADSSLISELADQATPVYGFFSTLNRNDNRVNTYNFYAGGTARNYFAGQIQNRAGNASMFQGANDSYGIRIQTGGGSTNGGGLEISNSTTVNRNYFAIKFTKDDSNDFGNNLATAGYVEINGNVGASAGTVYSCGANTTTAGFISTSDYRLKENLTSLNNASERIKLIQPKRFNYIGDAVTVDGFVAHELEQACPAAVFGTKDATEAIGTLADYNGTVIETEVTEPDELEYTEDVEVDGVSTATVRTRTWTPTGSRPVYQGVDQTKLIPLLTKALQEVMAKNEELETRLAALEGA